MIDTIQIVLLIVIIILTLLLIFLGIQVYFILRETRNTIEKANRVLDNTGEITESVSKPISILSALLIGGNFVSKFLKVKKKIEEQ